MAEAEYESMSYRELQEKCKALCLKAAGKKEHLVARLVEHQQQPADDSSAAGQDESAVVDSLAASAPIEEPEPESSASSPAVAEQEPQQPPVEPEADKAVEKVAGMGGKRKASAEGAEEEAPAFKHLKSPGVMLSRRPVPAIFAPKRVAPSPVLFPTAAAATTTTVPAAGPKPAAALGSSARKSVATSTTTSHRMSVLSKKPLATAPTPFGPGTYGSANSKGPLVAAAKTTAAATGSAGLAVAATASAKAALLKERPKINYRPHTGKLRPFFSPKPFLERNLLGAKVNMTNRAAATTTVGAGRKGAGPVVAKLAAAAATKQVL